jgi:hypothetical protein
MFAKATVKTLREIAAELNIKGRSGLAKPELFTAINDVLDTAHAEAMLMHSDVLTAEYEAARKAKTETVTEPYITVAELLSITGWTRLPRKYKKAHRKAGNLI